MKAFEAIDGTLLWSVDLPNQTIFTSPPTAANGIVYTAGSGVGGTLYAVDEQSGNVIWMSGIENGDHTSPALDYQSVFVSCACSQSYSFEARTGELVWFFAGSCQGGGGRTAVAHSGRIYVRDAFDIHGRGLVLDARSGIQVGEFSADVPPAFFKNNGFYLREGTLRAVDINTGNILWSFQGDGRLTSAPLIVNQTIYVGSSRGRLFAIDPQGQQCWSTSVGASIPAPDEHNAIPTTGLGAGDGLLVVPAGSILAVYGN
jgi:outer membrane protein assembly factor BamB